MRDNCSVCGKDRHVYKVVTAGFNLCKKCFDLSSEEDLRIAISDSRAIYNETLGDTIDTETV